MLRKLRTRLYRSLHATDEQMREAGVPDDRIEEVRWLLFKESLIDALLGAAFSGSAGVGFAIVSLANEKSSPFTIVLGALLLASSLFVLRMRFRAVYGLLEIFFALAVIYRLASASPGEPGYAPFGSTLFLIQVFAAVYIVVRGADNLVAGLPERGRKRVENFVDRLSF